MRPDTPLNAGTIVACGWLAMLTLAMIMIEFDARPETIGGESSIRLLRTTGPSRARAAEPADHARCAARDLDLVTAIETHSETQDRSREALSTAFFTLMKARAACNTGRIDQALAIYDAIAIDLSRTPHD